MPHESPARGDAPPDCPRCGYDLSGEIATWANACPLNGRCSECGLELIWAAVLSTTHNPRWLVENARRPLIALALPTLARTLAPARFWAAVPLDGRRRFRRVLTFTLAGMALVTLLAGLAEFAFRLSAPGFVYFHRPNTPALVKNLWRLAESVTTPYGSWAWEYYRPHGFWAEFQPGALLPLLFFALSPLAYAALPVTLGRCRVKPAHLVRAFLYGLPRATLWLEGLFLFQIMVVDPSYRWGFPGWAAYLLTPFRETEILWIAALALCQWRWWLAVNRDYLRLDTPRLVTAAMIAIAGFATLIPFFTIGQGGIRLVHYLVYTLGIDPFW